jgi:hypothetical protein
MQTTTELLNKMEMLIKELGNSQANACTCKYLNAGLDMQDSVGTMMDILGKRSLTLTQRSILLYLEFDAGTETKQRNICDYLGISMKCTRENCEQLMNLNYIKRGAKASTWSLV